MTYREAVDNIREHIRELSGDNWISDRAILSDIRSVTNTFVKREMDRRKLLSSNSLFTTLPCLEMIDVPLSECCFFTSECTIKRSKYKLPKIGEGIFGFIMDGVYSINGIKGATKLIAGDPNRYANLMNLNQKTSVNMFWLQNDYLYITVDWEAVRLVAYFEEDVPSYLLSCDEKDISPCRNPLDDDFKCPGYLISGVLSTVKTDYMSNFKRLKEDGTDNDTEILD